MQSDIHPAGLTGGGRYWPVSEAAHLPECYHSSLYMVYYLPYCLEMHDGWGLYSLTSSALVIEPDLLWSYILLIK